jgi:cyanophycinase
VPAPVPPGFTRGPILFIGHAPRAQAEKSLLQRFWNEAGGYGARILLVPTVSDAQNVAHLIQLFKTWETDTVDVLAVYTRREAQQPAHLDLIEHATAILFLDGDPLKLARILGGTPVAQAIRRANARSKAVGGIGMSAKLLCQHMITGSHQQAIQFAPGLGVINRMTVDVPINLASPAHSSIQPLLTAIAYNPFLVGVGVSSETGVVVYPDTTLEVFGSESVLLIDGADSGESELSSLHTESQLVEAGVHFHRLTAGDTFNFDQRTVQPLPFSDLPPTADPVQSKSPF